jgi:hypothetical protein
MAKGTPQQLAQKWAQNLGGATQAITDGVRSVTTAPGQAAAAQADVWAQNTMAAKQKFQRNSAAVSLQDWQDAMINKGATRVASGATAAQPKMEAFLGRLLPHIDTVKRGLPPRGNLDQNLARANAFARGMAQFKNQ